MIITIAVFLTINGVSSFKTGTSSYSTNSTSSENLPSSNLSGVLAVMITDPLTIPAGVTSIYVNYSDVQIHNSGNNNQSGWIDIGSSGVVNLLGVLNSTETIATGNISSGLFNALRLNVTGATITFQNSNYTANLIYQKHSFFVPVSGGISISGGLTAGVLLEMIPTVLLLGNTTDPSFAFIPAAKGFTLPDYSISGHPQVGNRDDFNGSISHQIHNLMHMQITSVALSPNSLSITIQNTGASTIILKLVALTAVTNASGGWVPSTPFGLVSKTSEFFVIAPNSTMAPVTSTTNKQLVKAITISGYTLAAHNTITFTYLGAVSIGALSLLQGSTPTQGVTLGQRYAATALGSGIYVKTLVTAVSSATINSTSSLVSNSTTS